MKYKAHSKVDEEFLELSSQSGKPIDLLECQSGRLYLGIGRDIGQLAICQGVAQDGWTRFEGLNGFSGIDCLSQEVHYDDHPRFGTWKPFIELKDSPAFDDALEKMKWLLTQHIDVQQTKVEWLANMPSRLRASRHYQPYIAEEKTRLEFLETKRNNGFSTTRYQSEKELIEARKVLLP